MQSGTFKVSGCGFEIPNLMRNQLSESAKTSQAKKMNYSTVFASEDNEMNFQPKKLSHKGGRTSEKTRHGRHYGLVGLKAGTRTQATLAYSVG